MRQTSPSSGKPKDTHQLLYHVKSCSLLECSYGRRDERKEEEELAPALSMTDQLGLGNRFARWDLHEDSTLSKELQELSA